MNRGHVPGTFTCPECGSHKWGSRYNFDGPGDIPMTHDPLTAPPGTLTTLDTGGRSTRYEGTFTRFCHGDGRDGQRCSFRWNSRDDAKYGIPSKP